MLNHQFEDVYEAKDADKLVDSLFALRSTNPTDVYDLSGQVMPGEPTTVTVRVQEKLRKNKKEAWMDTKDFMEKYYFRKTNSKRLKFTREITLLITVKYDNQTFGDLMLSYDVEHYNVADVLLTGSLVQHYNAYNNPSYSVHYMVEYALEAGADAKQMFIKLVAPALLAAKEQEEKNEDLINKLVSAFA